MVFFGTKKKNPFWYKAEFRNVNAVLLGLICPKYFLTKFSFVFIAFSRVENSAFSMEIFDRSF